MEEKIVLVLGIIAIGLIIYNFYLFANLFI